MAGPLTKYLPPLTRQAINTVFDDWDLDKSGTLELMELNKILRRGAGIALNKNLQYDPEADARRRKAALERKAAGELLMASDGF